MMKFVDLISETRRCVLDDSQKTFLSFCEIDGMRLADRKTDRQIGRQTGRQTGRQELTERQTGADGAKTTKERE